MKQVVTSEQAPHTGGGGGGIAQLWYKEPRYMRKDCTKEDVLIEHTHSFNCKTAGSAEASAVNIFQTSYRWKTPEVPFWTLKRWLEKYFFF